MPVRAYNAVPPADQTDLVDRLTCEWQAADSAATEPVVLEERNGRGEVVHVYVVWSEWADLPRERRGEVIMDAAERVKPIDDVLKITIAMGLTPDEADRFNIVWR